MPDRAVVDEQNLARRDGRSPEVADLDDPRFKAIWDAIKAWDIQRESGNGYAGANGSDAVSILDALRRLEAPRALVALSPDRQWAVLPGPGTTVALGWAILERQPVSLGLMATSWTWAEVDYAEDTGQDAHEVLAAWLEGRGG